MSALLLDSHESTQEQATEYYNSASRVANQYISKRSYWSERRVNLQVQHNE